MALANQKPNGTISLFEAAKLTGYHQDYLGQLCRAGKISAMKVGRNWYTTEQAVREFFQSGVAQLKQPEQPTHSIPSNPIVEGLPIAVQKPGENVLPVVSQPIHGGWAVHTYSDDNIHDKAVKNRNKKQFRNNHLRVAVLTAGAVAVAVILASGLLPLADSFLGQSPHSIVTNYDASPSSFRDESVAGAVDQLGTETLPNTPPALKRN